MKILGIMCMLIGVALTAFTTISVFTGQDVISTGDAVVTKNHWYSYNWSPILGIGLIIIGAVILLTQPKTKKIIYKKATD